MTLDQLIDAAAIVNAGYRVDCETPAERSLEVGFLYGTAELVLTLNGMLPSDSYSERREAIAKAIDRRAVEQHGAEYPLIHPIQSLKGPTS